MLRGYSEELVELLPLTVQAALLGEDDFDTFDEDGQYSNNSYDEKHQQQQQQQREDEEDIVEPSSLKETEFEEEGEALGLAAIKTVPPSSLAWIDKISHPDEVPWGSFSRYFSRHFFPSFCYGVFQGMGFYIAARIFRSLITGGIRWR